MILENISPICGVIDTVPLFEAICVPSTMVLKPMVYIYLDTFHHHSIFTHKQEWKTNEQSRESLGSKKLTV